MRAAVLPPAGSAPVVLSGEGLASGLVVRGVQIADLATCHAGRKSLFLIFLVRNRNIHEEQGACPSREPKPILPPG